MYQFRKEYEKLKKGPGNRQDVYRWLNDFTSLYWKGKHAKVAEIVNIRRYYFEFILAIRHTAPYLSAIFEINMKKDVEGNDEQREEKLLRAFKQYDEHMNCFSPPASSNAAFATGEPSNKTPRKGNKKLPAPKCLCGWPEIERAEAIESPQRKEIKTQSF